MCTITHPFLLPSSMLAHENTSKEPEEYFYQKENSEDRSNRESLKGMKRLYCGSEDLYPNEFCNFRQVAFSLWSVSFSIKG